ncbi:MAG: hypothetical protein Tsb0013_08360 [Phycisphaerales bacterium]
MSAEHRHSHPVFASFLAMLVIAGIALGLSTLRRTPAPAGPGDTVLAHITLRLDDGRVVYDQRRTTPLESPSLVPGLVDAIVGMAPGEARRVTIPPDRAYGERGRGDIPGNATLSADVRLIRVLARTGRASE